VQPDVAVARLLAALERRDDLARADVLHPDCSLVVDTGDRTGRTLRGRADAAPALAQVQARHPDASYTTVHVNGGPGLALRRRDGTVVGVLVVDVDPDGTIRRLWMSAAPGKLAHWNRRRPVEG